MVMGKIASGKTTLLELLAQHLPPTSGAVNIYEDSCYVLRNPVIFTGTIKINIILDKPFN